MMLHSNILGVKIVNKQVKIRQNIEASQELRVVKDTSKYNE